MQPEAATDVKREPLVALYRGVSWVSTAIRWQTRSVYSHAALRLPDRSVIESWHRGGVQRHARLGEVHTPGTVVDFFRVTAPVDWDAVLLFACDQIGKRYDWRGCARFVTRSLPDCHGEMQRWFCSSLVFAALRRGGVDLLERICPSEVSPAHLRLSPLLRFDGAEVTV